MAAGLLHIMVGGQPFLVQHSQVSHAVSVAHAAALQDERGQPMRQVALAPMLGLPATPARHALLVPTRRRTVALLVESLDLFEQADDAMSLILPVPPLIAQAVGHQWLSGIMIHDDYPLQLLDVRQIAQDALKQPT